MSGESKRTVLFVLVTAGSFAMVTALASAQTKKRERGVKPAAARVDAGARGDAAQAPQAAHAAPPTAPGSKAAREDAGFVETKTLDGGARVFRFGEMEIEGRLRNPQLVYFLRRVRAEFAAGELGHRTFMQELAETKDDPAF